MTFTQQARDLLKRLEGCRLDAYLDNAGVWTCGYGHTGADVNPATRWTQEHAEIVLDRDLARFTKGVAHILADVTDLSDTQYSVLVIFAYNVGLAAFAGSTLLRVVEAGHYDAVPAQLRQWVKVHDPATGHLITDPGLVRRRDAEIGLWLQGSAVA